MEIKINPRFLDVVLFVLVVALLTYCVVLHLNVTELRAQINFNAVINQTNTNTKTIGDMVQALGKAGVPGFVQAPAAAVPNEVKK